MNRPITALAFSLLILCGCGRWSPTNRNQLEGQLRKALPASDGHGTPVWDVPENKFDLSQWQDTDMIDNFRLKEAVPANTCLGRWELVAEFIPNQDGSGYSQANGIEAIVADKRMAMWGHEIQNGMIRQHVMPGWYVEHKIRLSGNKILFSDDEVFECHRGEFEIDGKIVPVMCLVEIDRSQKQLVTRTQVYIPNGCNNPIIRLHSAQPGKADRWFSCPMDSARKKTPSNDSK